MRLLTLALGATASLVLSVFVKDSIEKEAKLSFERQASDAKHAIAGWPPQPGSIRAPEQFGETLERRVARLIGTGLELEQTAVRND